jgi:RimJ/RimL family protein N-acetyltransferase
MDSRPDHVPEVIATARLRLRRWLDRDRLAFAAMNADPRVMTYYPSVWSPEESDAAVERIAAHFARHGFGLWAVEIPDVTSFAGYIGLSIPTFDTHFTPCVEIGWRLAADRWRQGYATEGARAVLAIGFDQLQLDEIVSFTATGNLASRRVMEKIGMTRNPADDFDHPAIAMGQPLRRSVLYRLARGHYRQQR